MRGAFNDYHKGAFLHNSEFCSGSCSSINTSSLFTTRSKFHESYVQLLKLTFFKLIVCVCVCVPEIKLQLSGLVGSFFIHQTTFPASHSSPLLSFPPLSSPPLLFVFWLTLHYHWHCLHHSTKLVRKPYPLALVIWSRTLFLCDYGILHRLQDALKPFQKL